jgi:hypothetical protein
MLACLISAHIWQSYYNKASLDDGYLPSVSSDLRLANIVVPPDVYSDQRAISITDTTVSTHLENLRRASPSRSGTPPSPPRRVSPVEARSRPGTPISAQSAASFAPLHHSLRRSLSSSGFSPSMSYSYPMDRGLPTSSRAGYDPTSPASESLPSLGSILGEPVSPFYHYPPLSAPLQFSTGTFQFEPSTPATTWNRRHSDQSVQGRTNTFFAPGGGRRPRSAEGELLLLLLLSSY